jgi:D-sedoheptulose 7-phosphate isomerase
MGAQSDFHLDDLLQRYPALAPLHPELARATELLHACLARGGKILVCGNGGSAADAEHIVGELMKSFAYRRPLPAGDRASLLQMFPGATALADALEGALPAISLVGQVGLLTAFANDVAYEYAFAQQVYGLGKPEDALIAISTSGNSRNVAHACRVARVRGLAVLGLAGRGGGQLASLCDVTIRVPADETHLVQELHLPVYHYLCVALEHAFFGHNGAKVPLKAISNVAK